MALPAYVVPCLRGRVMCPVYDVTTYGGNMALPTYVVSCLRGRVMCPAYDVTTYGGSVTLPRKRQDRYRPR